MCVKLRAAPVRRCTKSSSLKDVGYYEYSTTFSPSPADAVSRHHPECLRKRDYKVGHLLRSRVFVHFHPAIHLPPLYRS